VKDKDQNLIWERYGNGLFAGQRPNESTEHILVTATKKWLNENGWIFLEDLKLWEKDNFRVSLDVIASSLGVIVTNTKSNLHWDQEFGLPSDLAQEDQLEHLRPIVKFITAIPRLYNQ